LETTDYPSNVFVSGGYAYMTIGNSGLQIIDVHDPVHPKIISGYRTPNYASGVEVIGETAYVLHFNGLTSLNIRNPFVPIPLGQFTYYGASTNITIHDNYAFLSYYDKGLRLLDISDPTNITLTGAYATDNKVERIFLAGNIAYVANSFGGLKILDIGNPHQPELLGSHDTQGLTADIVADGSYAYVADGLGFRIYDITNPASPHLTGSIDTLLSLRIQLSSTYAYVSFGYGGIQIINIDDKAHPIISGVIQSEGDIFEFYIKDNYCYFSDYEMGLTIADISNPASPRILGSAYVPFSSIQDIFVYNNYAYVADWTGGLLIFDVSNPMTPVISGNYRTSSAAMSVFAKGKYLYLSDPYGLHVLNIENPVLPVPIDSIMTSGDPRQIIVRGNYAYIADENSMMILRVPAEPDNTVIPISFALYQNYPNPFNAQTTISYSLAEPGPVTLTIYNLLGQKVATLFDGVQAVGEHKVVWDAGNQTSGIYFYRISAGGYTKSEKMLLLK
jgi:hypothetical protein